MSKRASSPAERTPGLDRVQRPELLSHVCDPRPWGQRLAGDTLHQLVGRELSTVTVHIAAQPLEKDAELTSFDVRIKVPHLAPHLVHQLRSDQISKRVAGK